MNAKDYLSRYGTLDAWLERIEQEYDAAPESFELEVSLESESARCAQMERETREMIHRLRDFKPAMVLLYRYVYLYPWDELIRISGHSRSTVFRWHKEGLAQVQEILDRKEGGILE